MANHFKKQLHASGMHVELEEKALDVICGMELDPIHTKLHIEHKDQVYYFCSVVCKNHFVNDPEKYIG